MVGNGMYKHKTKRTLPIGLRLSLHVACISTILCLIVVFSILPLQYNRVEKDAIIEARILAEAVSTIYRHLGDVQPLEYARRLLLRMARMPHVYMVDVLDPQGIVLYSTDPMEVGKHYESRHGAAREDGLLLVTHLVSDPDSNIGGVRIAIDSELLLGDIHRLFAQVGVGLCLMVLILSILVKGLAERLISSRLARLMGLIENAEQGSFLIRAEVDREDEIGHVILGFNQLLGVITQIQARQLEKEHEREDAELQRNIRLRLEDTLSQLERSNERLKVKVRAQELLMEAAHRLGGTLKRESVVERLLALVEEKLTWPQFAVFLLEDQGQECSHLRLTASYGFSKEGVVPNAKVEIGEGVVGIVAQTGAPLVVRNLEKEKRLKVWEYQDHSLPMPQLKKTIALMAVPTIHKGRVMGVFLFCDPNDGGFDSDDVTLISALGAQTALAIVNAELYETTLELATSDPLTGVLNRRAMVKQIEFEMARAERFGTEVALLLVDVDHFKSYNDRMGHVLGDVALKEIAKALRDNIRKVDTVARFGGEEFCVILPQSDFTAAREVASKLCGSVRGLRLRGVEKQELGHLSVSIGIAVFSGMKGQVNSDDAVNDLIAIADQALYEAKKLGRDRFMANQT